LIHLVIANLYPSEVIQKFS